MKIRHERPMSDLSFQVRAPLSLELATGDHVTIDEWSLQGITFPGEGEILPSQAVLSIPFQGVAIRFDVTFKSGGKNRYLEFEGLSGRQRETLAVFYRSILSGRMASTEEVITSLDTPVDLVPMDETEQEAAEATVGKSPRLFRIVWNIAFYVAAAVLVFVFVGGQIWSTLSTIRVGQARVEAPLIPHPAAAGAYVDAIKVNPGDQVKRGDTLIVLTSPEHDGRLTEIREDINEAQRQVKRAEKVLHRHKATEAVERDLLFAAYDRARQILRLQDLVGGYHLEEVTLAFLRLRAFDQAWSNQPGDFHDILVTLEDALRSRRNQLARLKRRLGAEKGAGAAADIVALADGTVTTLNVFEDQYIARGTIALDIEESRPRTIVGWLDERLSASVHPGMNAELTVNVAGASRSVAGTVSEVVAGVDPYRPGTFGLRVTVAPEAWAQRDGILRPDAPVKLRLVREWSAPKHWFGWFDASS